MVDELDDLLIEDVHMYEVWAIGYDCNDKPTEFDYLLYTAVDPDDAITFADSVTSFEVKAVEADALIKADHFSIEVETTVANEADDEIFNIGTIYQRELWIDGEYGSEENVDNRDFDDFEDDIEDPEIVYIVNRSDYEILEDNTLKVSCDLLKGYNKNDTVFICLPHEDNDFVLTYKIMSRVMYEDGDYYHCELDY
jgi:hypothetical protein